MSTATLQEFTAQSAAEEQAGETLLLDVRPAEEFAAFHLRGSLQIGIKGPFAGWAGLLLHLRHRILLIADSPAAAEEARTRLRRVSIHGVVGYLRANEQHWREQGLQVHRLRMHRTHDLPQSLVSGTQLVDVRSRHEWLQGHLPGSVCVPLLEFALGVEALVTFQRLLIYCNEGYRATIAASMLLQSGREYVDVFLDGAEGWKEAGHLLTAGGNE